MNFLFDRLNSVSTGVLLSHHPTNLIRQSKRLQQTHYLFACHSLTALRKPQLPYFIAPQSILIFALRLWLQYSHIQCSIMVTRLVYQFSYYGPFVGDKSGVILDRSIIYFMKLATVLVLCVLAVSALAKKERTFIDFKSIIDHVNSLQTTWKAGHNHYFDGMDNEQVKNLMGTLETPEHLKLPLKDVEPLKDIPEEFFSADAWPNCESIKEVRDQSTCGSCWAFGAVEAMSDRICIASGQKLQVRISAEDLLTCCGVTCGQGCNGGYPSGAWNYFHRTGLVTGWLYNTTKWCQPYSFPECDHHTTGKYEPCGASKPTPKCKNTCVAGYPGTYATDKWVADSVYSVPSQVAKIQTEIMTHGPVEAAFTVYADFPTYKSGVYHHTTGSALGGHAIKIVGWGVESGTPYWLVANSWNEDWGNKGFFRIRRGNNECGIEGQVVAGIPKLK